MSDSGPFGNPFEGMPFFADIARMLGQQSGMAWDSARQLAVSIATDGTSEANVDPIDRMDIEQLGRVAELHVADVTGLSTTVGGRPVLAVPVNRTMWVQTGIDAYRPLVEQLAGALSEPQAPVGEDDPADPDESLNSMVTGMLAMFQPMLLTMTAGSMVGHLARTSLGHYDLPIPRAGTGSDADELLLIVPNLDAFTEEWSLAAADVRLWVCVRDLAYHAIFGVPQVRARMDDLLTRYVSSFRNEPGAFEEHLGALDTSGGDPQQALQELLGSPDLLLGAITTPAQDALRPELSALVSVITGVVDHVLDVVGAKLITSYPMLTEALRRRRVEATDADRLVARLFGLELSQATYDRGAAFVAGVLERAGDDGLRRLWADAANLPTPAEVDAPGLWLARIDLPRD